jgi:molecular chaperone GrpE
MDAQADKSIENELAELKDKYLRLFAEFDNYKKRTARERLDLIRTAAEDLVTKLLPVLDDFERAKKNADDS